MELPVCQFYHHYIATYYQSVALPPYYRHVICFYTDGNTLDSCCIYHAKNTCTSSIVKMLKVVLITNAPIQVLLSNTLTQDTCRQRALVQYNCSLTPIFKNVYFTAWKSSH